MNLNKSLELSRNILENNIKTAATRDGYGKGIVEAGTKFENVVVLTADLASSTKVEAFSKKFPKRYFEIGIAEQNMAGISAGLALSGKIPFMSSFSSFSPSRNWDQIRVSICYSNANVKIVGSHAGFSNEGDGATSQALEDIAIMRTLPNMVVLSPADYYETAKATLEAANHDGPVYIRLMRAKTPIFTTEKTPFKIGVASVIARGSDLTIIGTGPIVYDALVAAKELQKDGVDCEVINCSTIKPLDEETILKSAKKTKKVLTLEEHQIHGGLGGAVSELLSQKLPTQMKILGAADTFGESGDYAGLKDKYKISTHFIKKAIVNLRNEQNNS